MSANALRRVRDSGKAAERAECKLTQRVAEAREVGVTWDEIGSALGMTRQAAHKRFARLMDGDE